MTDRYTDGRYLAANPDWHESDAEWKANQVVRMITERNLMPSSIIDIGCGTGGVLEQLSHRLNAQLIGVDPSPQAVKLAREQRPEITFHEAEIESLGVRADLALMLDVFEHVEDCFGFLRACRDVADRFIFHIPLDLSADISVRGLHSPMRARIGHLHYFDRLTAIATLEDCGYEIGAWFYTAPGLEIPNSMKGRIARLPRKLAYWVAPDAAVRILGGYALMVLATPER